MSRRIGDIIQSLIQEHDMKQVDFANAINVKSATVSQWISNVREPSKSKMEEICDLFNVDMNYLYGITTVRNNYRDGADVFQVPLYNIEDIKDSNFSEDKIIDYLVIPRFMLQEGKRYFAIIMPDSSMAGCGLRENDIGIFEQTKKITKHQVGCILYDHKIIIRHYIPSDADIELFSTNRFYKNFFCEKEKTTVIGKLALSLSNHQW